MLLSRFLRRKSPVVSSEWATHVTQTVAEAATVGKVSRAPYQNFKNLPWDEWFEKGDVLLKFGKDIPKNLDITKFQRACHRQALKRNTRVSALIMDNGKSIHLFER